MAPTSAFGSVVRNAKMSLGVSPSLNFRTDVQFGQMPAKQARGRALVEREPDFAAIWPLPLVNVIPGIAIAYLQEDGLLPVVAAGTASLSLAGAGWTVWMSAEAVMRWMGLGSVLP
jgi:hypothetical protein